MIETKIVQKTGYEFEASTREFKLSLNATPGGPTPKELLAIAISGCSAMDVVAILGKRKLTGLEFGVAVRTEQTETHPKIFRDFVMEFQFKGEPEAPAGADIRAILDEAVRGSMTRYCGVSAMVVATVKIAYRVILNGEMLFEDHAHFDALTRT